jgi:hypothetical protein
MGTRTPSTSKWDDVTTYIYILVQTCVWPYHRSTALAWIYHNQQHNPSNYAHCQNYPSLFNIFVLCMHVFFLSTVVFHDFAITRSLVFCVCMRPGMCNKAYYDAHACILIILFAAKVHSDTNAQILAREPAKSNTGIDQCSQAYTLVLTSIHIRRKKCKSSTKTHQDAKQGLTLKQRFIVAQRPRLNAIIWWYDFKRNMFHGHVFNERNIDCILLLSWHQILPDEGVWWVHDCLSS